MQAYHPLYSYKEPSVELKLKFNDENQFEYTICILVNSSQNNWVLIAEIIPHNSIANYLKLFNSVTPIKVKTRNNSLSWWLPTIHLCGAECIWEIIKTCLQFFHISRYWDGKCSWNLSSWKRMINLLYIINIIAADDLATQGARASAAMVLT